jgi:hypothetical protein
MTLADALDIADETVALWRRDGLRPHEAWQALGQPWAGHGTVMWSEVRGFMVRWILSNDGQ